MADPRLRHDFSDVSVLIEQATGYDPIPTIEEHYRSRPDDDRYYCVFPRCGYVCNGPQTMWLHVHWGEAHGRSFQFTLRDLINALPSWPGALTCTPGQEADHG